MSAPAVAVSCRSEKGCRSDVSPVRGDGGTTLIEVLVSVLLLGTVGVAVLAMTSAAIIGARTSDELASSQVLIAEAADYLTDTDPADVPYRPCDPSGTEAVTQEYQNALDARFSAGTIDIVKVEFWDRPSASFGDACGFPSGYRLQQIELRTVAEGARRTVTVVKRPSIVPTGDVVAAPPAPPYAAGSGQAIVSLSPGVNG